MNTTFNPTKNNPEIKYPDYNDGEIAIFNTILALCRQLDSSKRKSTHTDKLGNSITREEKYAQTACVHLINTEYHKKFGTTILFMSDLETFLTKHIEIRVQNKFVPCLDYILPATFDETHFVNIIVSINLWGTLNLVEAQQTQKQSKDVEDLIEEFGDGVMDTVVKLVEEISRQNVTEFTDNHGNNISTPDITFPFEYNIGLKKICSKNGQTETTDAREILAVVTQLNKREHKVGGYVFFPFAMVSYEPSSLAVEVTVIKKVASLIAVEYGKNE